MPALLLYFIKLSCSLGLVWLFYRLVLHNLTFYTWNRWYLLGYSGLALAIPLINIGPIRGEDPALQPLIIQYIPVIGKADAVAALAAGHSFSWDPWYSLLIFFGLGSCFLLARFVLRWNSLRRMRQKAELLEEGPVRIFRVDAPIAPFSFGNAIYVNPEQHGEKEWEEIILHEYVHIRQRHTADILFAEFLVMVNWFNPFAWLIRYSIRQNLEFIADRAVVENGCDKKGYQYHLLKVVGRNQYRLANNFNFSSLKKRIIMMNKLRSARLHLLRFLFILPLLTVLLVAFRDRLPALHSRKDLFVNAVGIVIRTYDRTPLPGVIVVEKNTGLQTTTDANGYYKLSIPVRQDSVRVHLVYSKNGYESDVRERSWPSFKQTTGMCDVGTLSQPGVPLKGVFFVAPNFMSQSPADPGYEDALTELHRVLKENDQLTNYLTLKKAHPGIALWYISEDHQKRILVHTDGTAERYGYSGSPTLADMDAKYGALPDFMTSSNHLPNSGYLARWAEISAQAEKDFHTTSSDVKAILFPGDSRVIAVPASGEPQFYDMDNDDPKERPAFETLYGPLPACVPAPGLHTGTPRHPIPAKGSATFLDTGLHPLIYRQALWIVDGVVKPKGWIGIDSIKTENIVSMKIYKGAEAESLFGEKGADGVIALITKSSRRGKDISPIELFSTGVNAPLYVVDGVPKEAGLGNLSSNDVKSITVLKDANATALFGDKGANGVMLITTKNANHPHVVLEAKDTNGNPITLIADTIKTPQGTIHAVSH
jgi:TonB-dependent SusC/RagA subfamily outer membrane receptor